MIVRWMVLDDVLENLDYVLMLFNYTLTPRAPAPTGAFYFFNDAQSTKNAIRYLAPSPTTTANLEPLSPPK